LLVNDVVVDAVLQKLLSRLPERRLDTFLCHACSWVNPLISCQWVIPVPPRRL